MMNRRNVIYLLIFKMRGKIKLQYIKMKGLGARKLRKFGSIYANSKIEGWN